MQGLDQSSDTTAPRVPREKELLRVLEELYGGFFEAEETLSAIRRGEVDAFVVSTSDGEKIYTLNTAEHLRRRHDPLQQRKLRLAAPYAA